MAKQLWLNNFDTELTGAVKALPDTGSPATELGYGIIQLSGAMGTVLPALTGGDWFLLTLFKIVGGLEDDIEIVKVTSIDTSSGSETRLTVERGYEGTPVRAFDIGDKVSMRLTAGSADNFAQKSMNLDDIPDPATALANLGGEPVIAPPGSAPTEKFWRGDKTWADFATAVRATVLTGLSTATNAVITAGDTVLTMAGKLQKQFSDHFASTSNAHPATSITNTPSGGITATNVQDAINELDSEKFSKSGGDIAGNVGFTGSGRRITGNFSGVPVANRTLFQTSIANEATTLGIIPSGTGNAAYLQLSNSSDPDNSGYGYIGLTTSGLVIISTALGSGTKLPIDIDGRLRIGLDGSVLAYGGGGLGYGTGTGGTVTQPTSKSTSTTLNKPCGRITTHAESLAAGATAHFILLNSSIASTDTVVVNTSYYGDVGTNYRVSAMTGMIGACVISLQNVSGAARAEAIEIHFAVIKGANT